MVNALNINKKRFRIVAGVGSFALIALLITLLMTGTVFAAFPLAGVGGFTVKADKIQGVDFELYPEIGPTEKKDPWVNAAINIDGQTTINGLELIKTIDVETVLNAYNVKTVDIIVSSGAGVSAQGLQLRVTGLQSDDSLLTGLEISEGTDGLNKAFVLAADALNLDEAALNAHFLKVGSIGIPGLKIQIVHNKNNGSSEGGF